MNVILLTMLIELRFFPMEKEKKNEVFILFISYGLSNFI